jgi:hypothetical protein
MLAQKLILVARMGLLLCLPGLVGWSSVGISAPIAPTQVSLTFPPTADRGAPARSTGGGTRQGACSADSSEAGNKRDTLTALTPSNNIIKTFASHPSIYVYIASFPDKTAIFRVINRKTEEIVHQQEIALTGTPGLLKLSVPDEVELEADTPYQWGLFVICNPDNSEEDRGVEGWIERVTLDAAVQAQLDAATLPLEQAQIYAENGVWSETLEILLAQREQNPNEWLEFINSVEFPPEIAASPIVK